MQKKCIKEFKELYGIPDENNFTLKKVDFFIKIDAVDEISNLSLASLMQKKWKDFDCNAQ